MGRARRAPTAEELERMKTLVAAAMADGAIGLSTGLQYVPGVYAERGRDHRAGEGGGRSRRRLRHAHAQRGDRDRRTRSTRRSPSARRRTARSRSRTSRSTARTAGAPARGSCARSTPREPAAFASAPTSTPTRPPAPDLSIRFPAWALEGGHERITRAPRQTRRRGRESRRRSSGLLAERGFTDLELGRGRLLQGRSVVQRPVDQAGRRSGARGRQRGRPARGGAADHAAAATPRWSITSCRRTT